MNEKIVYNFRDLEVCLGKSKSTLWRMIQAGQLPRPMRRGNHFLGWRKETINTWLEQCEREAA